MTTNEIRPTQALNLRKGDTVLGPNGETVTLTSRPLYLTSRKEDPFQQKVTLRAAEGDIVVWADEYFDVVI